MKIKLMGRYIRAGVIALNKGEWDNEIKYANRI